MNEDDLAAALERNQAALDAVTTTAVAAPQQPWDRDLVMDLSYAVLGFTLLALLLCTALLWKKAASAADVLRTFGIVSIVGLSALLLITGFSNDQLTPIVGLFGAIAGYLLGRDQAPKKD